MLVALQTADARDQENWSGLALQTDDVRCRGEKGAGWNGLGLSLEGRDAGKRRKPGPWCGEA